MRGRKNKRQKAGKHPRRYVLAGLLVASSQVALAEPPVTMVPLPLSPIGNDMAAVRVNPFCQPVVAEAADTLLPRAPGRSSTAAGTAGGGRIRDTMIALSSGGELHGAETSAGHPRPPLMINQSSTSGGVRSNPLAMMIPHSDVDGVRSLMGIDRSIVPVGGVEFSFSDDDAQPVERESDGAVLDGQLQPLDVQSPVAEPGLVELQPTYRPASPWQQPDFETMPPGLPKPVNLNEPVNLRPFVSRPAAVGRTIVVPNADPDAVESRSAAPPWSRLVVTTEQKSPPRVDGPIVELQAPSDAARPVVIPELMVDEGRLVNGGRPRVEVGRPPVAIDRMASLSIVPGQPRILTVDEPSAPTDKASEAASTKPTLAADAGAAVAPPPRVLASAPKLLQSVLAPSTSPALATGGGKEVPAAKPEVVAAPTPAPTDGPIVSRYTLKPTEVRAVTIDAAIAKVQSDDLSVCAVVKTGISQIQLIATGTGTTRLAVFTVGKEGEELIQRYEVAVGETKAAAIDSPETLALTMTQTVQNAFPGSNVLVSHDSGRLIVTGSCSDDSTARRMLRMIRSACPMPVDDKLRVR